MTTLYVSETGAQVHKLGERILVKQGQDILQDIPLIKISRVVLMGKSIQVTTPTLYALAQRKICVFYLSSHGKFVMRMSVNEHNRSILRQAQVRLVDKPQLGFEIARAIVNAKISNQRVLIQRLARNKIGPDPVVVQKAVDMMDQMRRQLSVSQSLDELRGREGMAAKEYFQMLRHFIRSPRDGASWGFDRRAYYPPTDPINALLSFGYTLLLNDMIAACQITGLDPDLGVFHAIDYNKPAMALDLEEEFRPVIVDSIVLEIINRSIFCLADFESGPFKNPDDDEEEETDSSLKANIDPVSRKVAVRLRPILLKEAARKKFVHMYETRVNEQVLHPVNGEKTSYRRIFELQAYAMARTTLGEVGSYQPFTIR